MRYLLSNEIKIGNQNIGCSLRLRLSTVYEIIFLKALTTFEKLLKLNEAYIETYAQNYPVGSIKYYGNSVSSSAGAEDKRSCSARSIIRLTF